MCLVSGLKQTQSTEDIRWHRAHGVNALGAGHVSGPGLVHLLLLHLEGTQVYWQGKTEHCSGERGMCSLANPDKVSYVSNNFQKPLQYLR